MALISPAVRLFLLGSFPGPNSRLLLLQQNILGLWGRGNTCDLENVETIPSPGDTTSAPRIADAENPSL